MFAYPPDCLPRVALALSSGGYAGGGGMTGFASALDLFLGSHPVTAIGNFSGVSAGSLVSAYLAAGYSPFDIVHAHFSQETDRLRPLTVRDVYRPNLAELAPSARRFARAVLERVGLAARRPRGGGGGSATGELGVLPSGFISADGLAAVAEDNLRRRGMTRFSDLPRRLSISFYDVLASRRVVAGNGPGQLDLPIAEAITASSAIPGVYPPRRIDIGGGQVVLGIDGGAGGPRLGIRDLRDVDLIIAYSSAGFASIAGAVRHVSAPNVVGLSLQLSANQGTVNEIAHWMDAHPEAHAWVFEPPPTDLRSTLSYQQMLDESRVGFERTQRWLREHFDYFSTVLANHGVTVDPDFDRVRFDDVIAHGSKLRAAPA